MKKQKIDLKKLKVKSFVTSLNNEAQNYIKGGGPKTDEPICDSRVIYWCDC